MYPTRAQPNVETINFLLSVSKPAVQNWSLCVTVALIDTPKVFQRAESVWAVCSNKVWRLTFNLIVLLPLLPQLLNSKVKRDISNYHIWNVILILWPVVFYLLLWEELIKAFCVCANVPMRVYVARARADAWTDIRFEHDQNCPQEVYSARNGPLLYVEQETWWSDSFQNRQMSCPTRESNHDFSGAHSVAWSLYQLSYLYPRQNHKQMKFQCFQVEGSASIVPSYFSGSYFNEQAVGRQWAG
jgi:hypothetical protein